MLYAYPKLSTDHHSIDLGVCRLVFGPGLCNLLFPWSRAVIAAKEYDLKLIFPAWTQIQIGPLLRRENDKRFYHNLFCAPENYVTGMRKLYLLMTTKKITESKFLARQYDDEKDYIVVFAGMKESFTIQDSIDEKVVTNHSLIFNELKKMTRDCHKQGLNYNFEGSISVHVRLGDFSTLETKDTLNSGAHNYRIPLEWYCQQVHNIRQGISKRMPVYVFSDGNDKELSSLLGMDNVKRLRFGSSIADLLALTQANILIASGSTFSQWASYLGRMPVIWYEGQLRQRQYYENPECEIEIREDDALPDRFINKIKSKTKRTQNRSAQ